MCFAKPLFAADAINNFKQDAVVKADYKEIKKQLELQQKYSNKYDLENLKTVYSKDFINADGFNYDIYFDLIKKTWETYSDIKYETTLNNIVINGDYAIAQVEDKAFATTSARSEAIKDCGYLQSNSQTYYYFKKIGNKWLIIADRVIYEKTFLKYGIAKTTKIDIVAPIQITADEEYTTSLFVEPQKDTIVIASIGQEDITYPQVTAPEIFRKMSVDGVLERVFTSNKKDINEYSVASIGFTSAKIGDNNDLKIYITGLGFVMSRVNVIPKNNFVKFEEKVKNGEKNIK